MNYFLHKIIGNVSFLNYKKLINCEINRIQSSLSIVLYKIIENESPVGTMSFRKRKH